MFFGSQERCEYCDETRQLAEEIAALSDLISIEIYDLGRILPPFNGK
jgi:hypothetical protein